MAITSVTFKPTATTPIVTLVADATAVLSVGLLKVTAPNGLLYNNTDINSPDISPSVTTKNVNLPLDTSGLPLAGTYEFVLTIKQGTTTLATFTETFTYCYNEPEVSITIESNCDASTLTATDDSTYTLTCPTTGASYAYSTLVRLMTIKYPATKLPASADITTSAATYTVPPNIWTGRWTVLVSSVATWNPVAKMYIEATLYGAEVHDVECSTCVCDMAQCVEKVYDAYIGYLSTNPVKAKEYETILIKIAIAKILYDSYKNCGDTDAATGKCHEIAALLSPLTECCTSTTSTGLSQEVIPSYSAQVGSGTITVESGDNYIVVTAVTVGVNTTFTITLDTAQLNGAIAAYLAANPPTVNGSDVTLTLTPNCIVPSELATDATADEAIQWILDFICDRANPNINPDPRTTYTTYADMEKGGDGSSSSRFATPLKDNYNGSLPVITDVGVTGPRAQVALHTYFVDGQNVTKALEVLTLTPNNDNYVYLSHSNYTAGIMDWKVSPVAIGAPAPTTTGVKVFKIVTNAITIASTTYLLETLPVTDDLMYIESVEYIHPTNTAKAQNGNWLISIELATGDLVLYKRESGAWVERERNK